MMRRIRPLAVLALAGLLGVGPLAGASHAQAPGAATATVQAGTAVVAGQVIEASSGKPAGGALVTLAIGAPPAVQPTGVVPFPPAQSRRGTAVANADGRFVFRDVPAGTYSLTATLNGHAPGASGRRRPSGPGQPFTVKDGARISDAVVTVWRLGAISGFLRDDHGDPAVGISVWAMRQVMNAGRSELTLTGGGVEATDDRGYYRVPNLQPGNYVVTVRTNPQSAAVATVDTYQAAVTSGSSAAMRSEWMQTGGMFLSTTGLVVDGWQVSVSIGMPQPLPGPNGTVLLHPTVFFPNAPTPAEGTLLTVRPGDDIVGVDLTLPLIAGVRVSGVLMGPEGPAANHGVRLFPVGRDDPVMEIPSAYSMTDPAGRFALLGVTPGRYVVRAYRVVQAVPFMRPAPPAAGGPPISTVERPPAPIGPPPPPMFAEAPVTVGSTHVDDVPLVLQPGARLSGRVAFDGATAPPPAARMQQISIGIRPLTGTVPGADARVGADGRFTTSGYPPGRYSFSPVTPPGPEWTLASVRVGSVDAAGQAFTLGAADVTDVVVTFTDKVTTLSGTVRGTDAGMAPDATVVVFPADMQEWLATGMSPRRVATAATSSDGAYQVRLELPGDYMVVAVPPEVAPDVDREFVARFAASAVRVSIASGETRTQALTVSRPR